VCRTPAPARPVDLERVGATAAEGQEANVQRDESHLRISLAPPAAPQAATPLRNRAAAVRRDVSVIFGGCGDERHVLATLIDAGQPSRMPDPSRVRLRLTRNDHIPEVIARFYVIMTFLDRAAKALSSSAPPDAAHPPSAAVEVAVATFAHVYLSPTLCAPMARELSASCTRLHAPLRPCWTL
jgi:Domain of unknown function (DUF4470)